MYLKATTTTSRLKLIVFIDFYSFVFVFQQWICELLSRGLFNDCVKFAHDKGDLRLSALIHAASGSNNVRDILRHCAHEDVNEFYRIFFFVSN
jgi:hypothetical protein